MIVARGLGLGGNGSLVAFGLGIDTYVIPPVTPEEPDAGGGGSPSRRRLPMRPPLRRPQLPDTPSKLAQARAEDEELLEILAAALTSGVLR